MSFSGVLFLYIIAIECSARNARKKALTANIAHTPAQTNPGASLQSVPTNTHAYACAFCRVAPGRIASNDLGVTKVTHPYTQQAHAHNAGTHTVPNDAKQREPVALF